MPITKVGVMTNPLDLLNPSQYSHNEEQTRKRLEICHSCDFFYKPVGICRKCGCVMKLKTKLQEATCPLDKW
jgi:protein-arginine kinase activator protein McsA